MRCDFPSSTRLWWVHLPTFEPAAYFLFYGPQLDPTFSLFMAFAFFIFVSRSYVESSLNGLPFTRQHVRM